MRSIWLVMAWYVTILSVGRELAELISANPGVSYFMGASFGAMAIFARLFVPGIKDVK